MLRRSMFALAVLATAGSAALFFACGTDAVGVDACQQIETARCQQAPGCGIPLTTPLHSGSDVDSCIRYYEGACLHGLASGTNPGATAVEACVNAINSGDCTTVLHPELNDAGACSFLVPAPVDANAPAVDDDGGDAGTAADMDATTTTDMDALTVTIDDMVIVLGPTL